MTTLFLVRHGKYAQMDRVFAGRTAGIGLNREGRAQSQRLARWLTRKRPARIQSSPRARARQTAGPIGQQVGLPVEVVPALDEIDAGEWTGKAFEELNADPRWLAWNGQRSTAGIPGGETMVQVKTRILGHIERLHREEPDSAAVMVSHAEIIRAVVLHCVQLPLEAFQRVEIDAASVTTLVFTRAGAAVLSVNEQIDDREDVPVLSPGAAMEI